jgi:hypothetical protein
VLMAKPPPTIAPPLAAPNVANLRDALATIRQRLSALPTTGNTTAAGAPVEMLAVEEPARVDPVGVDAAAPVVTEAEPHRLEQTPR